MMARKRVAGLAGMLACGVWVCLGVASVSGADQIAVTTNGTKVILFQSGRWTYVPDDQGSAPHTAATASTNGPALSAADPDSAVAPPAPASGVNRVFLAVAGGIGALLLLVIAGILWFFRVFEPARKRRILVEALEILKNRSESQYAHAEELLNQAITSGLRKDDIQEAYFARAFLRAKSGNYEGASADLDSADRKAGPVLYLSLWILLKQKKMKDAYDLYDRESALLKSWLQADAIMSLVCFSLGREHWRSQEIDAAVQYFDRVRALGIHADRIPTAISDVQVAHGVIALFSNRIEEAIKRFESAKERAVKEKTSQMPAAAGLLLCSWRRSDSAAMDAEIAVLIDKLEKEGAKSRTGESPKTPGGGKEQADKDMPEDEVLLRNMLLLHAVSLVRSWCRLPEMKGLPPPEIAKLEQRVKKVLAISPDLAEAKLLLGLIHYYFLPEDQRDKAIAMLDEAKADVPEVSLLLKREAKLKELERDRLKTFFCMVRDYVGDGEVPQELKDKLLQSLEAHSRFKEMSHELSSHAGGGGGEATIKGMQSRGALLRKRVHAIVKPSIAKHGSIQVAPIEELMKHMEEATKAINENAVKLEKTELDLMVDTGEFLLKEEVPITSAPLSALQEPANPSGRASMEPRRVSKKSGGRNAAK